VAQFDIARARDTGDLRYLGYAEAALSPWIAETTTPASVLVLHATILQSRHAFGAALDELARALALHPQDAQGWLTRATVLRVLGRYDEALASCRHLADLADSSVAALCTQSIRGLTGHLQEAHATIAALPLGSLAPEVRAWRYSELGEMAERLGDDAGAEHWFREGLQLAPRDMYLRGACADLLLRHGRAAETVQLLTGFESMEPLLLRLAIAHKMQGDRLAAMSESMLADAFALERARGDAVHQREQARYFLDVDPQPQLALSAAVANWQVQREPDDILVMLRAATAAHQPHAAEAARQFLGANGLEDVRLQAALEAAR
jgi:tetratricopeptide (TPR) repeat protein